MLFWGRYHDVFQGGHGGEEPYILPDPSDAFPNKPFRCKVVKGVYLFPPTARPGKEFFVAVDIEVYFTFIRLKVSGQDVYKGGFTGTVFTSQKDHLAPFEV